MYKPPVIVYFSKETAESVLSILEGIAGSQWPVSGTVQGAIEAINQGLAARRAEDTMRSTPMSQRSSSDPDW